jgi:sulfate adenylyltransferase subunit 2
VRIGWFLEGAEYSAGMTAAGGKVLSETDMPDATVNGGHNRTHRSMTATLDALESEAIAILREAVAQFRKPVLLYSAGKDSAALLHLAMKAFRPAAIPLPLLHIDTGWKFREMIAFRDAAAKRYDCQMLVHTNADGVRDGINPFGHTTGIYTDTMKTAALRQAFDIHGFDAAIGGARRDEEKSRAKERIFSVRTRGQRWSPERQRPELWQIYNGRLGPDETMRVFPLSNWTERDVWAYIAQEDVPVVPLYFTAPRPVVRRDALLIVRDDERLPLQPGEVPELLPVRFRTLGCYPLTGAIEAPAHTIQDIIRDLAVSRASERQGRAIDHDSPAAMERKKQAGYF